MKIFDTTPVAGAPIRSKMFFTAFLRMARAWERLAVRNGHVDWSNGMPTIVMDEIDDGLGEKAMDYSDFAFGFSVSGAVVTITAGEIHHGTRAVVTVASVVKTITQDLQYIWVEYTFGGSAVIAAPSTTRPVSTETVMKVWLGRFNLTDSTASLNRIGHIGNIEIPGAFA